MGTIIIGAKIGNLAVIACDRRISHDDDFYQDDDDKFLDVGDGFIIACSGNARTAQIAERMINRRADVHFDTKNDVIDFAEDLQVELERLGAGRPDSNALPECPSEFMIGQSGNLWTVDTDFFVSNVSDYSCIGCGHLIGYGAMGMAWRGKARNKDTLELAIRVVCARNQFCGGEANIRSH